jgi:phosphate transport system substrate-binding protein
MKSMGIQCSFALLAVLVTAAYAHAQDSAPSYAPPAPVTGTLRIWGHPYMAGVTKNWAEGFTRFHPGVRFELKLMGSDTAVPGLYSGRADIALLGRENNITDDNGFSRPKQYKFTRLELMNGSLDAPGKSDALVVFVHRDNLVARLTLAQLDSIVSCERRRGGAPIRTWGDLGLGGEWARQPIRVHLYDVGTGTGTYFQHVVMRDSRKMNWERVTEYTDRRNHDRSITRAGEQIVEAVQSDRYALGISGARFATDGVKAVALAEIDGGPYYVPSRETLIARAYPLGRSTYALVDIAPGHAMDPKVREFLSYVLSREGQADVARDGGYLPLSAAVLAVQREVLK